MLVECELDVDKQDLDVENELLFLLFVADHRMKIRPADILIKDYTYHLPFKRIAVFPLSKRDESRLLIYRNGVIEDTHFQNLPNTLSKDSTLILNNTRVIEARILFTKSTGGVIEIFCLEPYHQSIEQSLQQKQKVLWKCMIGGASKWKHGQILSKEISIGNNELHITAKYIGKEEDSFVIKFEWNLDEYSFGEVLHAAGAIPLPPYIKREAESIDAERYQTIFASNEGSVAAPTAALHFTVDVFEKLREKNITVDYVTLHVGAGTFKPVKTETIAEHQMHSEAFTVSKKNLQTIIDAKKIVAVGTTTLRTLESLHWLGLKSMNGLMTEWELHQWEAYDLNDNVTYKESLSAILNWMETHEVNELHCRTSLIIVPGYSFKIPSALITNFHQPQSTLLLLIAAFVGDDWKKIYQHALDNDYRFLSYGDSSYLER